MPKQAAAISGIARIWYKEWALGTKLREDYFLHIKSSNDTK